MDELLQLNLSHVKLFFVVLPSVFQVGYMLMLIIVLIMYAISLLLGQLELFCESADLSVVLLHNHSRGRGRHIGGTVLRLFGLAGHGQLHYSVQFCRQILRGHSFLLQHFSNLLRVSILLKTHVLLVGLVLFFSCLSNLSSHL